MKSNKPQMLICDDERNTREALARFFRKDFKVTLAEDGVVALNLLKHNNYELVLTDMKMPGADGMKVLDAALTLEPKPVCIVFTAYGSIETAVAAVKRGAFDFVTKPVNLEQLAELTDRALEERLGVQQTANEEIDTSVLEHIVAESSAMREVLELVKQVAVSRSTVLLSGESGTGKEVIAQAIHQLSQRSGAFVPVHCAALPANLLESELFGYEKGAFTGAVDRKIGRFELANDGSLFLDEIGEIEPQVQVKLLRVLESRRFERVGGLESLRTTARLISATNRDLKAMVAEGEFREDLFYRLDVVNICLPPLRERVADIAVLVERFIKEFADDNGKEVNAITPEALAVLEQYSWPGNIRELRNCIERMIVLCRSSELTLADVPESVKNPQALSLGTTDTAANVTTNASLDLDQNEKNLIIKALAESGGNKTKAAQKLGISRRTLHRRLHDYNL